MVYLRLFVIISSFVDQRCPCPLRSVACGWDEGGKGCAGDCPSGQRQSEHAASEFTSLILKSRGPCCIHRIVSLSCSHPSEFGVSFLYQPFYRSGFWVSFCLYHVFTVSDSGYHFFLIRGMAAVWGLGPVFVQVVPVRLAPYTTNERA